MLIQSIAFEGVLSHYIQDTVLALPANVGTLMDPGIAERCAEMNNMTWDKINTCYQGELGRK